jgi:hypothetical protein
VELEVRHLGDACRIGRHQQVERAWCGFADSVCQSAVCASRFAAGDLLFEDDRDQPLRDQSCVRDAEAATAAPEIADDTMRRIERIDVVEGAAPSRRAIEHPPGTTTPGLDVDAAVRRAEPDRDRTVRRPRCADDIALRQPHRRIASPSGQRSERRTKVDRLRS